MKAACLAALVVLVSVLAGCAGPVVIDDGVRSRMFIPCTQDNLCFRNTYGIARDWYCGDYPVTYRNNDNEFESRRYEWIYQPQVVGTNPRVVVYR
ncbi:MAG TPA: hypothetical protein HPP76_01655 [Desulfuromonadales bacterium]|nr:hypothetical protein [Desulfuromonadales bacterium]